MNAQVQSVNLDGKSFKVKNGKWVTASVEGEEYIVNTRSMTVKLRNQHQTAALQALANAHGFEIERTNKLGYTDIKLSANSKFYEFHPLLNNSGLFESVEMNSYGKKVSNDPGFPYQYYLKNQSGYPHINCDNELWENINGEENPIIVAVLDDGLATSHGDFESGIVGYDFVDFDNDPSPMRRDKEDHGVGVAGIIGATTNNGWSTGGIAGGYNAKQATVIMALRIMAWGYGGWPPDSMMILNSGIVDDAIMFAADNGAKIINMSFTVAQNAAIDAAIEYAYKYKGCLLVAASGNAGGNLLVAYPARSGFVIAVGGINKDWSTYGNYNGGIDIVAPTEGIYSTDYSDDEWGLWGTGTSASAPQVCGIGALLLNYIPNLLHVDIQRVLKQSALKDFTGYNITQFGGGIVRAWDAIGWADNSWLNDRPANVQLTIQSSHPVITWNTVPGNYFTKYNVYRSYSHDGRYFFTKIGEVNNNPNLQTHSFTDNTVATQNGQIGTKYYYYRINIQSTLATGYEGVLSEEVNVRVNDDIEKKFIAGTDKNEFKIFDNYPNPFNPTTNLRFIISSGENVKIIIHNALGEKLIELINGFLESGEYVIPINMSNYPSGLYFSQITIGSNTQVNKMLLTK